jgi:hypothetical protein
MTARARTASPKLAVRIQEQPARLDAALAGLERMSFGELQVAWTRNLGTRPPIRKSRDVLMRLLAWHIQEQALGGLDPSVRRKLERLGKAFARDAAYLPASTLELKPGTELVRVWKGAHHVVRVHGDGFEHQGQRYGSLSEVARHITGSRWSGPLFFGLKAPRKLAEPE